MPDKQNIAVIGLGKIGFEVARKLCKAGHNVIGYRRSPCPELAKMGANFASSVAEAVQQSDVVFQCLPDAAALHQVASQTTLHCREGQIFIELSSYEKADKITYRDALAAKGARLIEVEISGTPIMLNQSQAALFVASDDEISGNIQDLLKVLSPKIIPVGGFGAAIDMKLVANLLVASHTLAAAEALVLASSLKLDLTKVVEIIGKSPAASTMFNVRAPLMLSEKPAAMGPVKTMIKYLEWIEGIASKNDLQLNAFSAAYDVFNQAIKSGKGDSDIAVAHDIICNKKD